MSIPGLSGDRASYDVIYRARWDGTELTEGAAKARAEIQALQKANSDYNRQASQESRDVAAAAKTRASAEQQLTSALRSQEAARIRLNIAENQGYATPEQYFQYRQRELQQQQLLNKARNNGRDTPDQVVADIKNETAAVEQKGKQVSNLASFFEELATAQERSNKSDPFAAGRGSAERNLKSYADQVRAVIGGLQTAIENDPFSNGTALKRASLNVQSFVDGVKKAINDVNTEVENVTNSSRGKSGSSFFTSFSNTTKDINKGLKGISENAKKAAEDGDKSASDLDIAWKKFKYTLDSVRGSASNIFNGAGGGGGGFGSFFASGAAAGGSFLSVISSAIPAVTSLWGVLGLGVTVLPLIISGVLALATGIIGLTASIGTLLLGMGAVIPIFVALAGAAIVLKEAVEPVVKAISALGNATNSAQVQAALKGLSPAAQAAALALSGLSKAFKGDVQQAFWKPLLPSLKELGTLVKPITTLMDALAGALGNFFARAISGFEKFAQSPGFKTLSTGAVTTINNLGSALVNVFDIITKLAVAGQPITNFITTGISDLTSNLDKLITTAQNNGSLNKFFDSVLQRMMLIGNIFSNVFGAMHNLFVAFLPVGDAFLQEIDGWAKRFDAFSKNRKALSEWAQDAIPFLKSLGDILASIVSGIVRLGSNPQNLKDLTDIFQGIGKVVGPLFNLMQALFDLFSRFAAVAAPLIGSALSGFARAVQDVANWVRDIESHRVGIDALKTLLGIFGGLVVSASLVNFVGKLIALAGSSWKSLQNLFGFFGFGGGNSGPGGGGSGGGSGGPAQAAADTQLKAAQMNLTASENNLRAAGLMETASSENVAAGEEMGAAVVGGSGGGRSFGSGLLGALGTLGGILGLVYGNQAVNKNTAPNTGGRAAGEAGVDITGGALVGGSLGGLPGAIIGGVIGGVKAIFDNGTYLNKLLNTFNPNTNAQKNLYTGPVQGTYLSPKGTNVDPVTGLPIGKLMDSGTVDVTVVDPSLLGNILGQYNSQVPNPRTPPGANILPPIKTNQPKTQTYLQPQQQPGDPRANPNFGYGSQDKPIISAHFLDPVVRFFSHDIAQWSKDAWHAAQDFFTGPFVRFFTDTIPHAAGAFGHWFIEQNKQIWHTIQQDGVDVWQHVFQPVWHFIDRDVYQPVEKFIMHDIPNFFTQTVPKWWDTAYGWFMRDIGTPVSNFVTKSIPNFFTQTVPKWWDAGYSWFMRDVGTPVSNFITKSVPDFFTQTIPHWFDNVGSWFNRSVISPITNFFSNTLPSAVQNGFKAAMNWVIDHVIGSGSSPGGIIGLVNKVAGVVGVHIPGVPHLATGGKVPGPDYVDHDAVYAKLTPGEFVIRKKAAKAIGPEILNWLNTADMRGFAGGGQVPNPLQNPLTPSNIQGQNPGYNPGLFGSPTSIVLGFLKDSFDALYTPAAKALISPLGNSIPGGVAADVMGGIKSGVDSFLGAKDKAYAASALAAAGSGGSLAVSSAVAALAQAYAASQLGRYGWGQDQMPPLVKLWNQESGWNPYAVNPSSGAYGIPQSLGHGHPFNLGDYKAQVDWGLGYIKPTYGSPSGAWAHEERYNWYNKGGFVMPDFGMGFATPSPMRYAHTGPGRLSQAAQALSGGKSIGLNVETMNINNPVRETAGQSVQRQLVKNRTYAGRG